MSDSALPAGAAEHRDPTVLARLVLEMTLLSRHHPAARRRTPFQLDRSAYLIMTRLQLGAPLSLRELAEAFGLDVSTINRQVAAMLDQDLVERVPDPDGGVARKIRPSDKGLRLFESDLELQRGGVAAVLADWPDDEIELLVRLMERFNEGVEGLVRHPWPRPHRPADSTVR
ncbi:MarR family winged helix-turn-helix transcriptional regulator [Nocardia carnea]|uniref:MarR family winged helix-turn-helix transcriptional regulator n=1 Tax=Nocardia carnea TaxID=37328 RepID=UPI00245717D9|nr:MarR family winged helix-turn-helix transcriptional regulator [Nocardia carnea]